MLYLVRKPGGELLMLGFDVSERSISRWMKRAPRDPEPGRRWLAFLRNHREAIAAMTNPTLSWQSNVATVNASGLITANASAPGQAIIEVRYPLAAGGQDYIAALLILNVS